MRKSSFYARYIKRLLDVLCVLVVFVLFWWVYVVLAVLVRVKLGSPVLFRQERPGKNGNIFKLFKFRSMTDARDKDGNLLPDEMRLTKFGKLLRSTSLDELPELLNILKGEMSLVGPRPLLAKYLPLYSEHQARRHEVTPGLTGYAQVNGRNAISWEEKFDLDVYYVDHISFALDVKIMFQTVKKVICRDGIASETSATMEEFSGTKESSHA